MLRNYLKGLLAYPFTSNEEVEQALSPYLTHINIELGEKDESLPLDTPVSLHPKRYTVVKKEALNDNCAVEEQMSDDMVVVDGPYTDIKVENIDLHVDGHTLLKDGVLCLRRGVVYGLVGTNGVGKSTLLRWLKNRGVTSTYLVRQESGFIGKHARSTFSADNRCGNRLDSTHDDGVHDITVKEYLSEYDEREVTKMLVRFGFKDHSQRVNELSGGWQKKLTLLKALLSPTNLLLLDEPTNMLDLPSIHFLENALAKTNKTVLVVSHDIAFLNSTCQFIIRMKDGLKVYKGSYDEYVRLADIERRNAEREYEKGEDARKRIQVFVDRFRCNAKRAGMVQSRIKMMERMDRVQLEEVDRDVSFGIGGGMRGEIVRIEGVDVSYNDGGDAYDKNSNACCKSEEEQRVILKNLNMIIRGDSKILVVGPNGAGKSTLLKTILSNTNVSRIPNLKISYFAQHHHQNFSPTDRVLPYLITSTRQPEQLIRSVLSSLNLKKDYQFISSLSGGQKTRLMLAKISLDNPDLLLLDEPTNHLDISSIVALRNAVREYKGAVVCVSHDLWFVNGLFADLYVVDGSVRYFRGTVDEYKRGLWSVE
ncbi:hypothetical protein VCUG_01038 [Vavraia culicis subsp. floridensis]|uniref:ABC transporter domain-containing protein n=1 Tax=Vavraia culicis (isolate floridensis) TaxID=948595 RepID=L2GV17_VAVCU|nr:uncharacterized protein VCUG_01038 [Vavraia culicis subsp. floridensis]ELA47506.1 hypothetical protein VCUG_01038 [Vavraia culicis subsp. floridensis]